MVQVVQGFGAASKSSLLAMLVWELAEINSLATALKRATPQEFGFVASFPCGASLLAFKWRFEPIALYPNDGVAKRYIIFLYSPFPRI